MKNDKDCEELERERRKLNRLVDDALENDTPISRCDAIIEQSRKVDALIEKIRKEKDEKNQYER